jgi:epoxyqueuosine reductase QueG
MQNTKIADIFHLADEQFREKFKGSAVKRAERRGLLKNAEAATPVRAEIE